ncbi:flagellar biosynthetic protein FliO [Panacagrimonas perspica]|uniref:Flagellar protein n=1 Tax=Panacagrimonas perspica TaxID=381431 RepID=A0A4R7NY46_9GAMM|nr:flagellar biosynthetic protein FliO [Panacagrimonas perspica]TDU25802.1 flagellar biosynthetic protein FliO [Panacagrimonas perspica]THD02827.1 flagellar biosynthetic protein FliO [Panacagrimonas perspica]
MEGAGSVVQMVLSLVAVVAVILGLAWMTRRMQGLRGASNGALRVKATIAVGMKERVVLIEASGRQFVIGVAPGCVNLIGAVEAQIDDASRSPGETREGVSSDEPAIPGFTRATEASPSFRDAFARQLGQLLGR